MAYATLEVSENDGVTTVTLNNGPLNAMTDQMGTDLSAALAQIQNSKQTRCLILTAEGRYFCVGGDLSASIGEPDEVRSKLSHAVVQVHDAFEKLAHFPAPVIVAVNGDAAGIGMSLSMLGDIVIASDAATFKAAYASAGITPDGGMTSSLAQLVGMRTAKKILLLDPKIPATTAVEYGLINEAVPPDFLYARVQEMAEKLADGPTSSYACMKSLLRQASLTALQMQLEKEAEALLETAVGPEGREGIRAFVEKRSPNFRASKSQ